MSTDAVQAFNEAYATSRHFLPFVGEIGKKKWPGTSVDKVDAAWRSRPSGEADDALDVEAPEDDADDMDDDRAPDNDDDAGTVEVRCASCAEVNTVAPPDGYAFERGEADDETYPARFACSECGTANRLRGHRLRRIQESAAQAFHESYRQTSRPIQAADPVEAFAESYDRPRIRLSPAGVMAISTFLQAYRKR